MVGYRYFIAVAAFLCLVCFATPTAAQEESGIFINEVMWNGSESSSADEWIELYNKSNRVQSLDGLHIYDDCSQRVLVEISDGQIAPGGYFLISNNSKDHLFTKGQSILDVDPDIVDSGLSLSNSNFKISLRDSSGTVLDVAGDGAKPFFYEYKRSSFFRKEYDLPGNNALAWSTYQSGPDSSCDFSLNIDPGARECASPTPSGRPIIKSFSQSQTFFPFNTLAKISIDFEVSDYDDDFSGIEVIYLESGVLSQYSPQRKVVDINITDKCPAISIRFFDAKGLSSSRNLKIECYQLSNEVWISEILPHPSKVDFNRDGFLDSRDEFIEIVNSGSSMVNLAGWYFQDSSGKKYVFPQTLIAPLEYIVIYKSDSGIAINDSGETIKLYSPDGVCRDSVSVGASSSRLDISLSKWAGRWIWSKKATPEFQNIIVETEFTNNPEQESLVDAVGKELSLTGRVIEKERSSFVIDYEGVRIDVLPKESVNLELGQSVSISGIVSGGRQINMLASKISILDSSKNQSPPFNHADKFSLEQSVLYTEVAVFKKKTKITSRRKNIPLAIKGVNTDRGTDTSKIPQYMIYLSGVFSLLLIILTYEICCRE